MRLKKPLYAVVEDVLAEGVQEVVILTDLDQEGKKLYAYLFKHLNHFGVKVNNELRDYLFEKTQLRQTEGIVTYIEHQNAHSQTI